jgi:hypothetical protein
MEKRIVYEMTGGGVGIISPAYNDQTTGFQFDAETEADVRS